VKSWRRGFSGGVGYVTFHRMLLGPGVGRCPLAGVPGISPELLPCRLACTRVHANTPWPSGFRRGEVGHRRTVHRIQSRPTQLPPCPFLAHCKWQAHTAVPCDQLLFPRRKSRANGPAAVLEGNKFRTSGGRGLRLSTKLGPTHMEGRVVRAVGAGCGRPNTLNGVGR
jgi:hypothetical protein